MGPLASYEGDSVVKNICTGADTRVVLHELSCTRRRIKRYRIS